MTAFQQMDVDILADPNFGQAVQYSRPASQSADAVNPVALSVIAETSGDYASPTGAYAAALSFPLSTLAIYPAKGDIVVPAFSFGNVVSGQSYFVQELEPDINEGWIKVKIRKVRQQ